MVNEIKQQMYDRLNSYLSERGIKIKPLLLDCIEFDGHNSFINSYTRGIRTRFPKEFFGRWMLYVDEEPIKTGYLFEAKRTLAGKCAIFKPEYLRRINHVSKSEQESNLFFQGEQTLSTIRIYEHIDKSSSDSAMSHIDLVYSVKSHGDMTLRSVVLEKGKFRCIYNLAGDGSLKLSLLDRLSKKGIIPPTLEQLNSGFTLNLENLFGDNQIVEFEASPRLNSIVSM
jgi:hypothetical protein